MNTENMPTTNQSPENATLLDKIPPTVAKGFEQVATAIGNVALGTLKQVAGDGMNAL